MGTISVHCAYKLLAFCACVKDQFIDGIRLMFSDSTVFGKMLTCAKLFS